MPASHPPASMTGIQSRSSAVLRFAALLEDERQAARRADVETLVAVDFVDMHTTACRTDTTYAGDHFFDRCCRDDAFD